MGKWRFPSTSQSIDDRLLQYYVDKAPIVQILFEPCLATSRNIFTDLSETLLTCLIFSNFWYFSDKPVYTQARIVDSTQSFVLLGSSAGRLPTKTHSSHHLSNTIIWLSATCCCKARHLLCISFYKLVRIKQETYHYLLTPWLSICKTSSTGGE